MFFNVGKAQDYLIFKDSIKKITLQKHIEVLCAEKRGGRKFGTQGEKNAACYIREQFMKSGLDNWSNGSEEYYQEYTLSYDTLISFYIQNTNTSLSYLSDFFTWEFCFLPEISKDDLIYAGFGLDGGNYSDYSNIDVTNKWVVVEFNSPIDSSGNLMDYFDFSKPLDYSQINLKKSIAQKKGAKGVIFKVNSDKYPAFLANNANTWYYYRSKDKAALNRIIGIFPAIFARHSAIDSLMGVNSQKLNEQINNRLKKNLSASGRVQTTVSFKIDKQQRLFNSQNVIGILEGEDKSIETIVSAHYDAATPNDSLFFPGANDNASGASALIQLANVFSKIAKSGYMPKKSIAFVAFSGEEEGLVGSNYFVNNKPFLIDSNAININIDCIGISEPLNDNNFRYIYINENDDEIRNMKNIFTELASKERQSFNLKFDTNINYSDQASFYYDGYQAMQITTGWGPMHTPQDSPESIDYDVLESATRFIFDVILAYNHFDRVNK